MSYQIEARETVEAAVRRIAKEQIKKAIRDLDDSDLGRAETVHEVRKRCKKIRGLIRLTRPAFEDTYDVENAFFRDAARSLSDLRDATSLLECFDALMDRYEEEDLDRDRFDSVRRELLERREDVADDQDAENRLDEFRSAMKTAKKRVGSWELEEEAFEAVAGGIEKTYTRARKAMKKAYKGRTDEQFHEWRKRVKYHRYHCRLISGMWPALLQPRRDEVKRLTDYLGDDHDLAIFRQTLVDETDRFGDLEELADLLGLIDARRAELQAWAAPLGHRLFAEDSKRFLPRLEAMWQAWQREHTLDAALPGAAPVSYA
jgi:CHAD domain-containing protein